MSQKISKKNFEEAKEKKLKFFNLENKEHILNNLVCNEQIDTEVLDKLIRSDLLKKSFRSPFADHYYENERDQLLNYKDLVKNGCAVVEYKMKKGISFGRVIPCRGLGLFNIRREIRQTLCKKYYYDIDVENCHPVIINQIAKKNNIEVDFLEQYIDNRDRIFKECMQIYKCDRDCVKRLFIRLMYFGSFKNWAKDEGIKNAAATEFIENFTTEIKEIGTYIFERNKQLYNEISKTKEDNNKQEGNIIGSVVSYYLQEWEHRILEVVYEYCVDNDLINDNDCVLCADGLMIKKEKYNEKLLKTFSKLVKKNLDFDVVFTQKEMKQDYLDILDEHLLDETEYIKQLLNYDTTIDEKTYDNDFHIQTFKKFVDEDAQHIGIDKICKYFNYTKSFKYFNKYHFTYYQSGKIYKIFENKLEAYNDLHALDYIVFNYGIKKYSFPSLYIQNINKNIYSSFAFNPNLNLVSDKYNLFRGFKYDDTKINFDITKISIFLEHVKYLCRDHEETAEYFLNWMAHIIQKPDQKTEIAIVLFSHVEGIGKNILWDIYAKIMTGYNAKFRDTDALTDKFNSDMMAKLFVIGDEIKARATEIADELKDIITRKEENIEFKGKDKFLMNDYKNYAFTTNNENVFKITKSDRRYFMIEAPEEKREIAYYNKLASLLNDDEALKHLHYYLKNRNISKFNTRNIVVTEYKQRLIMEHLPAYYKFFLEKRHYEEQKYEIKELYDDIISYARNNKMQSTFTETFMSRQFKKILQPFNKLDKATRRSIYLFPKDSFEQLKEIIKNEILNK